jgi:hypothetical protein
MPLCTQIVRDGETLRMPNGWGWWHVVCMNLQSQTDETTDPAQQDRTISDGPLGQSKTGEVVVQYATAYRDPSDGEVLTLQPGDILRMWRES